MAYFKLLPNTKFQLPNGTSVDSKNILKSFVFSDDTRESKSISKVFYDQVKRLEYLSHKNYSNNSTLYWITPILNQIDSFSKVPFSQTLHENIIRERYSGKVYYIQGGKNTTKILPGDLLLILVGDDWKYGGIVKEYDSLFRRIILHKEEVNSEVSEPGANPVMSIYRSDGTGTWNLITQEFNRGRVENESEKITKIFETGETGTEVSQFLISDTSFDFSDDPVGTILDSLSQTNGSLDGYRFETLVENETRELAEYKNLLFTSTGVAFKLSTFLTRATSENFERGQVIRVS